MRLQALDGWRGLACLLVAVHHLQVPHALYDQRWLQNAAPMLELFFIISGFVVSLVFAEMARTPRGAAAFILRMLGRIWPLHMVMLGSLVILALLRSVFAEHGGFTDQMTIEALGAQVLLIQTWVGVGLSWNYPAWTLSTELAAYLMFAGLMLVTRSRAARIIGASALALLAATVFLNELGPREHYNIISLARTLTGFFIGFLLREAWSGARLHSAALATVLELAAVIGVIWTLNARLDGAAYFLNYAIFGFTVIVFASDRGLVSRALMWAPIQWLGKVSFSIYMVHGVITLYLVQAFWAAERFLGASFQVSRVNPWTWRNELVFSFGSGLADDAMLVFYFILVLASATLVYRFIEAPTRAAASAFSVQISQDIERAGRQLGAGRPFGWRG